MDCFTWVRTGCSATLTDAYATIAMIRNLNEDVNTESVDCLAWVKTVWFNCKGACVGARDGARERVAVAVAVAALLAGAPDSGDAQAGGVSPPFTVCARSWFEVWGSVWASEGGGGVGWGEREG